MRIIVVFSSTNAHTSPCQSTGFSLVGNGKASPESVDSAGDTKGRPSDIRGLSSSIATNLSFDTWRTCRILDKDSRHDVVIRSVNDPESRACAFGVLVLCGNLQIKIDKQNYTISVAAMRHWFARTWWNLVSHDDLRFLEAQKRSFLC